MASTLEQVTGELAKNPSDADAVQRFVERCLERADAGPLRAGLEPTLAGLMGPLAVRPVAQAFAKALTRAADRASTPLDAVELHLRAARVLAQVATDRLGAARSLAAAWKLVPDERVALLAQSLFQGTADVPDYTLMALANVGQGEQRLLAMRKLAAGALERRKLDAAEALFLRLQAMLPSDVDAAVGRATIARLRADADAKVSALEGSLAAATAEEQARIQRELGDAHRSAGRRDEAEEAYRRAVGFGDETALRSLEQLLRDAGRLDALVELWEGLLPSLPRERQLALRRRLHHLVHDELGRRDDARRMLGSVPAAGKPVATQATPEAARALELQDKPRDAAARWEDVAGHASARELRIEALERAARLWQEVKEDAAAERCFRKLRALDPHSRAALAFFRDLYKDQADARRAYQNLAQLHTLEPRRDARRALATEMAALAEGELGSHDKAIESWRLIEKDLDPGADPVVTWGELKRLYAAAGRWHAYVDLLERWVERLAPAETAHKIELLFDIVDVYQDPAKLPMPAMVLQTYHRIVTLAPTHRVALDGLAVGLEAREQWSDLLPVLAQKIELETEARELIALFQRVAEIYLDHIRSESQAVPILERLLELAPDDIEIVRRLRELHRRRHDSDEHYQALLRELELTDPNAQVDRIRVLSDLATLAGQELLRPQVAIGHWREVLDLDPQNAKALEALSALHAEEQDWPAFVKVLEQRVAEAKTKTAKLPLLLELGEALYTRVGDVEQAEKIFASIAETSPTSATARRFLQRIFVTRRKWADLARLFTGKAPKGTPLPAAKWKEYVALLRDAVKHEVDAPLVADIHAETARVLEDHLDDKKGALEALDAALRVAEDRVDLARRAQALMGDDVPGQRRLTTLAALARHATDPAERHQAWLQIASIHRRAKDSVQATEAWGRALVAGAELGLDEALPGLEEDAGASGRWEQAFHAIDEALGRLPPDATDVRVALHRSLGTIARARLLIPESAVRHFKWVLQLRPGDAFALEELEKIHFSRNDFQGLEEVYRARVDAAVFAQASADEQVGAYFKLARLYEDVLLDPERAAVGYQEILALAPHDEEALAGLQRSLEAAQAHGDLAASLEAVLTRVHPSSRAKRNALHLRLANLYSDRLGEPLAAIDHARAILESEGDGASMEGAVALLERLVHEPLLRQDASPILEATYRKRKDLDKLAHLLEARLDDAPKDELPGLLDELAMLAASALDAPDKAFEALLRRFRLTPAEPDVWVELERAASALQSISGWETVAAAYQAVIDDPSRPLGAARPALRLRLADIHHRRLIELEEAIAQTEAAIAESRDEDQVLRALETLEVLYKKTADLESFVRVKLESARRVISRAIRRQKVSEAAQALAGALGRPDQAIATLEPIWREDPGDPETFDLIAQVLEKTGDFARLETLYTDAIPMARDAVRADELRYRHALLRRDRLGLWEMAISELIGLVESPSAGERARSALLEIARAAESEAQRDVILEVLDGHYRGAKDDEGLLSVLLVSAEFAPAGPDKARALREAAAVALPPAGKLDEVPERAHHALTLYMQALLEHPADAEALDAMGRLAADANLWSDYAEALATCADAAGESSAARPLWRAEAEVAEAQLGDEARAITSWARDLALGEALGEDDVAAALDALDGLHKKAGDVAARLDILRKKEERAKDPLVRAQILEEIALLELETDRDDDAVTTLERALEELGRAPRAKTRAPRQRILGTLESVLFQGERYSELVDLLVQAAALEDDPIEKREILHRAAELAADSLGDDERAIVLYERLVERDATDEAAIGRLVELYTRTERWADCVGALGRQRALAEQAEAYAESRELSYRIGEILADNLGETAAAVTTFGRVLAGDPAHEGALAALSRYEADDAGVASEARLLLAEAHRRRGDASALARVLELAVAAGEETPAVRRELAELWMGPLAEPLRAWPHAVAAYTLDPQGDDGAFAREHLLTLGAQALAGGESPRRLVDALVSVSAALPEGGARLERERADLLAVTELIGDAGDVGALVPLWRALLADDPRDGAVLAAFEAHARAAGGLPLLAEALGARVAATDPVLATPIEVELAAVLGRIPGRQPDAIAVLRGVLAREPERVDAVDALARLFADTNRHAERAALYDDQLGRSPARARLAELRRALATTLWRHLGDVHRAVTLFGELLAADPADASAADALEAIWGEGRERPAVFQILEPRYQQLADWDKLVALYTSTLEQDDQQLQIECLSKLAELERAQLDKPEAAFTTLLALVERLDADPVETRSHLDALEGLAQRLGRWDELVEQLEALVAMGQGGAPLMARLGRIHDRARGDAERAIHFYGFAYERAPEDRETRDGLAELLERTERWEELARHLSGAATFSESDSNGELDDRLRLRRRAARVLDERLGLPREAVAVLEEIVAEAPVGHPLQIEAHETIIALLERVQDYEVLHAHYRSWLEQAPSDEVAVDLQVRLGRSLVRFPETAREGLTELEEVLRTSPGRRDVVPTLWSMLLACDKAEAAGDDVDADYAAATADAARLIEEVLGPNAPAVTLAGIVKAQLRVLPVSEERRATLLRLADLETQLDRVDAAFGHYAEALRSSLGDAAIEASLEALADKSAAAREQGVPGAQAAGYAELAALYEECAAEPDHEARYGLKVADILRLKLGRPGDAAQWYERHLLASPGSRPALEPLATYYHDVRDPTSEARILVAWIDYSATPVELAALRMRLGILRMDQLGDAQGAIDALEGCLPEGAGDPELVKRLERLYVRGSHFEALVELYQAALGWLPASGPDARPKEHLEVLAKIAQVQETRLGDLPSARDICRRMLDIEPLSRFALATLERLERQLGDWDAVDEILGKKLVSAPNDAARAKVLIDRAEVATTHRKRPDEALEHLLQADKLLGPGPGPDELVKGLEALLRGEPNARLQAARALQKRYRARQSWTALINVLLLELVATGSGPERFQLSQQAFEIATERLKDKPLALRVLLAALRQTPETEALRELVARTAAEVGDWALVIRTADETLKRIEAPDDVRSFALWLGSLVLEHGPAVGGSASAVRVFERVLEVDPGNTEACQRLVVLYRGRGDWSALRGLFTERLATAKPEDEPRIALEMLLDLADAPDSGGVEAVAALVERHLVAHAEGAALVVELERRVTEAAGGPVATHVLAQRLRAADRWDEVVALLERRAAAAPTEERARLYGEIATIHEGPRGARSAALTSLARALGATPNDPKLWRRLRDLGQSLEAWGKLAEALGALLPRVTDAPLLRELGLAQADILVDQLKDDVAAVAALKATVARDATFVAARERLLELWRRLGDLDAYEHEVATLTALVSDGEAAATLWRGLRTFARERGDEARQVVADEALLDLDPGDDEAADHLAELHRAAGRGEDLSDLLFLRIQNAQDDPARAARHWAELAEVRATLLDDAAGAGEAWREAFTLDASHAVAAAKTQASAEAAGDWERAAEVAALHAAALEPGPDRVAAWVRVARLYEDKVRAPSEAASAWEATLEDAPDHVEAMTALIGLYGRARRFDELGDMLERKARHAATSHERHVTLVQAAAIHLDQRGDAEAARGLLDQVLRDEPGHTEARLLIARLHVREGEPRLAAATLAAVAEEVSGKRKARILMDLARLESQDLGELEAASAHIREAWHIDRTVPGLEPLVVQILSRAEDWRGLRDHHAAIFEVAKGEARAAAALELARLYAGVLAAEPDSAEALERWLAEARKGLGETLELALLEAELAQAREDFAAAEERLGVAIALLEERKLTEQLARRHHELGRARDRLGKPELALESFARSHEIDGKYLPNLLDYGHALVTARRWPDALAIHQALLLQRTAITDEAERYGILERLALVSWEVGQRERARQYLQRLLSERPDHAGALALKRRFAAAGPAA